MLNSQKILIILVILIIVISIINSKSTKKEPYTNTHESFTQAECDILFPAVEGYFPTFAKIWRSTGVEDCVSYMSGSCGSPFSLVQNANTGACDFRGYYFNSV